MDTGNHGNNNEKKDNAQPPRVQSNRVHQYPQWSKQQKSGNTQEQESWTQQEPWKQQLQQKRLRPTSKGEANEAGFSSGIYFYVLTKHPTTLNVVLRATESEQEVIGPVKKQEHRGLDKNDWEF